MEFKLKLSGEIYTYKGSDLDEMLQFLKGVVVGSKAGNSYERLMADKEVELHAVSVEDRPCGGTLEEPLIDGDIEIVMAFLEGVHWRQGKPKELI